MFALLGQVDQVDGRHDNEETFTEHPVLVAIRPWRNTLRLGAPILASTTVVFGFDIFGFEGPQLQHLGIFVSKPIDVLFRVEIVSAELVNLLLTPIKGIKFTPSPPPRARAPPCFW